MSNRSLPIGDRDLHAHSTASDGTLSPGDLVRHACGLNVRTLALTDHDSTGGLDEAFAVAGTAMQLVPGVEISVSWQKRTLHVVGLNIDPAAAPLRAGLERLKGVRECRSEQIAGRLEALGVEDALDAAHALCDGVPTRTHFARLLVSRGRAKNMGQAFKRYLKPGKPAYAPAQWATLEEALDWIHRAGGQAVLAHPLRYGFTGAWLRRTLTAFAEAGGDALEVACGTSTPAEVATAAGHAVHFNLLASVGSDYHGPENPWVEVGRLPALPDNMTPVWRDWH